MEHDVGRIDCDEPLSPLWRRGRARRRGAAAPSAGTRGLTGPLATASNSADVSKSRMESFSDGVIAVAITLLILNITVPAPGHQTLAHELGRRWPQYAAYVVSFLTIGIIWINHHAMIDRLREVNHAILFLNLLLLMSVVFLPFATALMAEYLRVSRAQHLAAAVWGGSFLLMSAGFTLLNVYTLAWHPELLLVPMSDEDRRRLLIRSVGGAVPYVLAVALAPITAVATLILCGAVAFFYALPVASRA